MEVFGKPITSTKQAILMVIQGSIFLFFTLVTTIICMVSGGVSGLFVLLAVIREIMLFLVTGFSFALFDTERTNDNGYLAKLN